jgi:hypothetical protein
MGHKHTHVFIVRARDSNTMMIQEHAGGPISWQVLVKEPFRGDTYWRPFFLLDELIPHGLPDIKWNDLYYLKWGKFIPEEKKKGFKYYLEKPPSTLTKAIAEQSAQAKKSQAGRS